MGLPGPLKTYRPSSCERFRRAGKHLLSLINDLLDLARIESGKIEMRAEPIECRDLLEDVALGLRPLADAKAIELEVVACAGWIVNCDRRALRQILINLANNAIKFTDQGAVRLILTRQSDDAGAVVRFSVTDTGCGIHASDQARLFAAFEQVGGEGAQPYEGRTRPLYLQDARHPARRRHRVRERVRPRQRIHTRVARVGETGVERRSS